MITPLLSQLQGWPGWQKNGTMLRYLHLVCFCARIEPKLSKLQKTTRKQGFFDDFLSILTVFWSLFNFGSILAQKLNRFICEKKNWIFWHPGHPWSCESSGEGKIRALSDTVFANTTCWKLDEWIGWKWFLKEHYSGKNINFVFKYTFFILYVKWNHDFFSPIYECFFYQNLTFWFSVH